MDSLDVARWQFAITTVYHFFFVPITIGLSAVVAYFHIQWVRTHDESWFRLTKFFGKLFMINFALGLVTGIVQEFQFGMNWSGYSRFVGDIFGAPLAFEALLAFFMESTFLGLWLFGWGRLPEKVHALTMVMVHIGTVLSAYFILAANSFMQHPVGYAFNPETGRAEMSDFWAVLTNPVQLVTFPHVITGAYMTAGAVVLGVGVHKLRQLRATPDAALYRRATRAGAILTLVASLGVIISGDVQGKIMTDVQPMKMAAAEALYETTTKAPFSVLSIGNLSGTEATHLIEIPGLLSFLGTGSFAGEVQGIDNLRVKAEKAWGEGTWQIAVKQPDGSIAQQALKDIKNSAGQPVAVPIDAKASFVPNIPLSYWTFRFMMGAGFLTMLVAALALIGIRKGGVPTARWWTAAAVITPLLPVFANSFGWIFTEIGRQPWIVFGLQSTAGAESNLPASTVWTSLIVYTLVYAVLAVIEVRLFLTYVRRGAEPFHPPAEPGHVDDDAPLQFAY